MTDNVKQALDIVGIAMKGLDAAAAFTPAMGPAGPIVAGVDVAGNILLRAANTVYAGHAGGKSWFDSLVEALNHLDPEGPNSPILSGMPGAASAPAAAAR